MKRFLIINPNTSEEMTEDIRRTVMAVKSDWAAIEVRSPDFGPRSLESFRDYALASFAMLRLCNGQKTPYDGVLVCCFGDPGLYAIKETLSCPVLGIAESSMSLALLLGQRFSILAASEKAVPMMRDMVGQYGLTARLASVEAIGLSVLEAERDKETSIRLLTEVGKKAKDQGAETLILGCAGMTGLKHHIETALGMPVLDPVECGYRLLETLAHAGISHSRAGLYAPPNTQEIVRPELLA